MEMSRFVECFFRYDSMVVCTGTVLYYDVAVSERLR